MGSHQTERYWQAVQKRCHKPRYKPVWYCTRRLPDPSLPGGRRVEFLGRDGRWSSNWKAYDLLIGYFPSKGYADKVANKASLALCTGHGEPAPPAGVEADLKSVSL